MTTVAAFVLPWWGLWLLSALLLAALAILIWPRRQQAQVGTTTGQQPEVPTAEQAEDATARRLSALLRRLGVEIPEGADLIQLTVQYIEDRSRAEQQRLHNITAPLIAAKEQVKARLDAANADNQYFHAALKTAGDEKTRLEAEVRRLTAELKVATEAKKRAEADLEAAKQKLAEPAPAEPLPATAAADSGKPASAAAAAPPEQEAPTPVGGQPEGGGESADEGHAGPPISNYLTEMLGSDVHDLAIAAAVLEVGKSGKGFGIRRVVEELTGRGIEVTEYSVTYVISALADPRIAVCSMQIVRLKPGINREWFDVSGVKLPDLPPAHGEDPGTPAPIPAPHGGPEKPPEPSPEPPAPTSGDAGKDGGAPPPSPPHVQVTIPEDLYQKVKVVVLGMGRWNCDALKKNEDFGATLRADPTLVAAILMRLISEGVINKESRMVVVAAGTQGEGKPEGQATGDWKGAGVKGGAGKKPPDKIRVDALEELRAGWFAASVLLHCLSHGGKGARFTVGRVFDAIKDAYQDLDRKSDVAPALQLLQRCGFMSPPGDKVKNPGRELLVDKVEAEHALGMTLEKIILSGLQPPEEEEDAGDGDEGGGKDADAGDGSGAKPTAADPVADLRDYFTNASGVPAALAGFIYDEDRLMQETNLVSIPRDVKGEGRGRDDGPGFVEWFLKNNKRTNLKPADIHQIAVMTLQKMENAGVLGHTHGNDGRPIDMKRPEFVRSFHGILESRR